MVDDNEAGSEYGTQEANTQAAAGQDRGPNSGGGAATKTVGSALGEIAWLLSQSGTYRHSLFLGDLEWLVMPPLAYGQYRLFYAEGQPVGVALWAYVTEEAEKRLAAGGRIGANEWRDGSTIWLVELVAPFGHQEAMLEDLRSSALSDRRFRFLRVNAEGRREVVTVAGKDIEGAGEPTASEASG